MWIVGAAAIFIVNIGFAWLVMSRAIENLQFSPQDQEIVTALSASAENETAKILLRTRAIDAVVSVKNITNKQAITLAAFGGAFGLCAAGFALFLIGADGAFQFNVEQPGSGAKVVLSSTAPGLFCFLVAGVIVIVGILHPTSIKFEPVSVQVGTPAAQPAKPAVPPGKPAGHAPSDKEYKLLDAK
jgi:hypothetical protein